MLGFGIAILTALTAIIITLIFNLASKDRKNGVLLREIMSKKVDDFLDNLAIVRRLKESDLIHIATTRTLEYVTTLDQYAILWNVLYLKDSTDERRLVEQVWDQEWYNRLNSKSRMKEELIAFCRLARCEHHRLGETLRDLLGQNLGYHDFSAIAEIANHFPDVRREALTKAAEASETTQGVEHLIKHDQYSMEIIGDPGLKAKLYGRLAALEVNPQKLADILSKIPEDSEEWSLALEKLNASSVIGSRRRAAAPWIK